MLVVRVKIAVVRFDALIKVSSRGDGVADGRAPCDINIGDSVGVDRPKSNAGVSVRSVEDSDTMTRAG
jgi:hypothetical protein